MARKRLKFAETIHELGVQAHQITSIAHPCEPIRALLGLSSAPVATGSRESAKRPPFNDPHSARHLNDFLADPAVL
jgi:hypothetical protein